VTAHKIPFNRAIVLFSILGLPFAKEDPTHSMMEEFSAKGSFADQIVFFASECGYILINK
jgi:hypothetical protein